jgi:hypothetical protein
MVIDILAHVVQIIVLSSGADAFLSIDGTLEFSQISVRTNGALENRFELKIIWIIQNPVIT